MITRDDIQRIHGSDVYSTGGEKIGSAGQVYLDTESGNPEWVSVKTGLFGLKESFVPLEGASVSGDRIEVRYDKEQVKDAPRIDVDGDLSPAQEEELYHYYGVSTAGHGVTGRDQRRDESDDRGDTSGPDTDDAMTRSEERLVAGTRTEQAGKARLRKYVVTEQQQVDVPVAHEEATLTREPITDANVGRATDGPRISEEEHEVTLHAERPVVETETVPVERVRLDKQTVRDQQTVSGEVRKEEIDLEGADGAERRGR
ncbi:hypothetical protein Aab01nite_85560 [Paractinoplanes abujensis]|uniref:Uncharacterized protein (TIGR02271 family) n=1 Tax=Paractinoplanes abujensis TaxID=882441 RepID=A0A7W7G0J3_9ACTN|nr:PRC and DUF2382 domain-containing protein [Actinoplanes abujensis]MBB4693128.1 uncharacterized protein (TIGR02271 family) [Actinoplanes abujensis]GID24966.1 hypothetical protein Aab01nite_85560 [Actinoplanes abujensis]